MYKPKVAEDDSFLTVIESNLPQMQLIVDIIYLLIIANTPLPRIGQGSIFYSNLK